MRKIQGLQLLLNRKLSTHLVNATLMQNTLNVLTDMTTNLGYATVDNILYLYQTEATFTVEESKILINLQTLENSLLIK